MLYGFGRINAAGERLVPGDDVPGGSRVEVGKRSLVSLQLGEVAGRVSMVVRENSTVLLRARRYGGEVDYTPLLVAGKIVLKIEDLPGSERVLVDAPGIQIDVRGTQFSIANSSAGAHVDVVEGVVRVRPRLEWLERIPPSVRERSAVLRSVEDSLERVAVPVAAGQRGEFDGSLARQVTRAVPELERLTKNARFQSAAGAGEAQKLAELIDGDMGAMDFGGAIEREFEEQPDRWVADRPLEQGEAAAVQSTVFRWSASSNLDDLDDSHCRRKPRVLEILRMKDGSQVKGCVLMQTSGRQGRTASLIIQSRAGERREIPLSEINAIDYSKYGNR